MMKRNLLVAFAAASMLATGCIAPDGEPPAETSQVESAVTVLHTLYNEYWNQYLFSTGGTATITSPVTGGNYWVLTRVVTTQQSFKLQSNYTGLCAWRPTTGNAVVMQSCAPGYDPRQTWDEVLVSINGVPYVELRNESSGLCLDTIGGSGSQIGTFGCANPNTDLFTAQTWKVN